MRIDAKQVLASGLFLLTTTVAFAACGYPDPGTASGGGPIAGTVLPSPSVSPSIDNFNDGAGLPTIKLLDGLAYIDLKVGDEATVGKGDKLTVQYTGWLASNRTKFDSSRDRGTPFDVTIGVGQVIAGWDEGLLGMKVGGKRKLIIPSALGYGTAGQGTTIPANSALVFDVEVIAAVPAPPPSPTPVPAPSPT